MIPALKAAAFVLSAAMAGGTAVHLTGQQAAADGGAVRPASLSDRQIADVARSAGCWHGDQVAVAVAVALAESGGRTGVHGDVGIANGKWGPSVGLWQIRSLNADRGTGRQRDEKANTRPAVNARHACQIWVRQGWGPWSTWRHGTYRRYLARASTALKA